VTLKRLYAALALLQLVPIWAVHYLPTADGPAHLYNAWVVRELASGRGALLSRYFAIQWAPIPNWTDHAVLALLMTVIPPLAAEKVLVSAIVLVFLAGAWIYAGDEARVFAFLAFPLVFHQLLIAGFYNFSLSLGLYLMIVGIWWQRRHDPDLRTVSVIALLLVLCYFTHPMSTALAIASIGFLWLTTSRRPLQLLAFLPVAPLIVWYVRNQPTSMVGRAGTPKDLLGRLATTQILFNFDPRQFTFGKVFFVVLLLLAIVTVVVEWRFREDDALLVLTLILVVAYLRSPGIAAGGLLVAERTSLFIYLVPIAWFSPRIPKPMRTAIVVASSIVAVLSAGFHLRHFRHYDRVIADFLVATKPMPNDVTFLPLLFERNVPGSFTSVISHAAAYAAVEKHLVDFDNYEPRSSYFPIVYRGGVSLPKPSTIESSAAEYDFRSGTAGAQYLFLWKAPEPVLDRVEKAYKIFSIAGSGRVYDTIP
jgi:hypothetical protein